MSLTVKHRVDIIIMIGCDEKIQTDNEVCKVLVVINRMNQLYRY